MPELVDIPRAAKILSISTRGVYRLLEGDLPSVRIGRRRLINIAAIEAFIGTRETST
jgi:excisionase family DNA binding protein